MLKEMYIEAKWMYKYVDKYKWGVVFYIFLILTIYFQIQTIISYINQFHNKSKEKIIDLKGKNIIEKIKCSCFSAHIC